LESKGRLAETRVALVEVTVTAVPPTVTVGATHGVAHRPEPLMLIAVGVPAAEYVVKTEVTDGAASAAVAGMSAPRVKATACASWKLLRFDIAKLSQGTLRPFCFGSFHPIQCRLDRT